MQKTLFKEMRNMMIITRIRTSCWRRKISLTYQLSRFRKSKNVFSIMMHRYKNNRNLSWKISNHDQKNQNQIHIRNSKVQKIQKIYERKIVEHNSLCYLMNKKLSVVFRRSQKHNKKQLKNTKNQWTEE